MNVLGCVHMATMGQSSQYGEEWPLATVITTFVSTVNSFFLINPISLYTGQFSTTECWAWWTGKPVIVHFFFFILMDVTTSQLRPSH